MDDIRQTAIDQFQAYLARRQFSAHTVASYTSDLRLFFTEVAVPLGQVSFHEVDQFVESQQQYSRSWATINRRLNALKHFFDFALVGFQGRGCAEGVQPDFCHALLLEALLFQ